MSTILKFYYIAMMKTHSPSAANKFVHRFLVKLVEFVTTQQQTQFNKQVM